MKQRAAAGFQAMGIFACAMGLLCGGLGAGQIHTWTDENGVLHMTDTPPPESAKRVETYRYRPRPDKDLNAVQQIRAHEKDADRLAEAEKKEADARKRAMEAARRANEAETGFEAERGRLEEMIEKATKRKKDALLIDRQKAVVDQAAGLAREARRQAQEARKLAEETAGHVEVLRRAQRLRGE